MLKYFVLFISSLFFYCCSLKRNITSEEVSGNYYCSPVGGVGYKLELKKDSTFLYNWGFDLAHGETEGTWVIQNNVVILNSYKQPDMLFTILKAEEREADSLEIKIFESSDTSEIFYAECCLKSDTFTLCDFTNINGNTKFPETKVDSIFISSFSFTPIRIKVENQNYNYYEFIMDGYEKKNFKYFTNKRFLHKKNNLVDKEFKSNKFIKLREIKKPQ